MKIKSRGFRRCSVFLVSLAAVFAFACPASATWFWIHGSSGHLATPDILADPIVYYGWGLDLILNGGASDWVHFAVPTQGDSAKGARYLKLSFYTYSADCWVSDIHVWNGETKIKEFTGEWSGSHGSLQLDLGKVVTFGRGLGVSVRVKAGMEDMDHRAVFYGVGANFVNKP